MSIKQLSGERITSREKRAAINNVHVIDDRLVRASEDQTIGHIDLHIRLTSEQAKRAEVMIIGLYFGNSHIASWPLSNISQGGTYAYVDNDADTDKRVAVYLLISGLILGDFIKETLKNSGWRSRCEAAKACCEALEAQIIELKDKLSAFEQHHSKDVAHI